MHLTTEQECTLICCKARVPTLCKHNTFLRIVQFFFKMLHCCLLCESFASTWCFVIWRPRMNQRCLFDCLDCELPSRTHAHTHPYQDGNQTAVLCLAAAAAASDRAVLPLQCRRIKVSNKSTVLSPFYPLTDCFSASLVKLQFAISSDSVIEWK